MIESRARKTSSRPDMGTVTTTVVFQAADQTEYEAAVAQLDQYQADPANPPLTFSR